MNFNLLNLQRKLHFFFNKNSLTAKYYAKNGETRDIEQSKCTTCCRKYSAYSKRPKCCLWINLTLRIVGGSIGRRCIHIVSNIHGPVCCRSIYRKEGNSIYKNFTIHVQMSFYHWMNDWFAGQSKVIVAIQETNTLNYLLFVQNSIMNILANSIESDLFKRHANHWMFSITHTIFG